MPSILLAHRDGKLRKKWAGQFRDHGFLVLEAMTFLEARQKSRAQSPDVAIIDLHLSEGENRSPVSAGRAIDHSVPTIIISDQLDPEVMRQVFRRIPGYYPPAVDFLVKNEDFKALIAAVRRALIPRVFVAHGHDLAARDEVIRFLRTLELRPVVLGEEPEVGRTIIEKFEDYSDVAFAIVLLTPDDVGGTETADLKPRARQNVIFELGYFFGKLGRRKVVALYKTGRGELDMPSNYSGILDLAMDSTGGWKKRLADEMIAANFEIDLQRVLWA
jgi:predicted nucleotide-binding protein